MKYSRIYACCIASLFIGSAANALTVPESGQDNRIEWNMQQNWPTSGKYLDMVHSLDGKYVYMLNDKQQVQVYNNQGQLQGSIPVEEGVTNIDIAPQGELLYLVNNAKQTFSSIAVSFVIDIDTTGAPFKGPADAPVTIALFTDFECPYCRQIIPLLDQILERNPKTLKLAFKNMPLKFHKFAEPSAKAALAAHEQGKFWEYHDRLFAEKKLSDDLFKKIAVDLQLDIPRFEKDMASPEIQAKMQKDMIDAQNAGVTGTPTIFINGRTPKQRTLEGLQSIIDDELRKKENK
ncbi:MAG: membrane protein [Desulfobulbaceae bacterium BRH_c16a]|nr:MAG: membrane protein [Desulfobulbaceae bacterium BRH_c16a]